MQYHKWLCAGVMMCATLVARKFDCYILDSVTWKLGQTRGESVGAPTSDAQIRSGRPGFWHAIRVHL